MRDSRPAAYTPRISVTDGTYRADADNWQAIAALVCGILTFVTPLGIVTAPLALFYGIAGRRRGREGAPHGGLATAGIVLGAAGLVLVVLFFVGLLVFAVGSTTVSG